MALRLGNIEVFDCLGWIDVISGMAFLAMDLQSRGRPKLASIILNRWIERSGDAAGLHTWRWYLVYRALVRAKVALLKQAECDLPIESSQRLETLVNRHTNVAKNATTISQPTLLITQLKPLRDGLFPAIHLGIGSDTAEFHGDFSLLFAVGSRGLDRINLLTIPKGHLNREGAVTG